MNYEELRLKYQAADAFERITILIGLICSEANKCLIAERKRANLPIEDVSPFEEFLNMLSNGLCEIKEDMSDALTILKSDMPILTSVMVQGDFENAPEELASLSKAIHRIESLTTKYENLVRN